MSPPTDDQSEHMENQLREGRELATAPADPGVMRDVPEELGIVAGLSLARSMACLLTYKTAFAIITRQ